MESLPPEGEVADEINELVRLYPGYTDGGTWRLSFIGDEELIGYAIVRMDCVPEEPPRMHIFESVMSKYDHIHNFVPGQTEYRVRCGDRILAVRGIMYCQQNALSKACAQVAIRSLLSSVFPNRPIYYSEINRVAGVEDPKRGLSSSQIRRIIEYFGIPFADLDYETEEGLRLCQTFPYHRFIYTGMESGLGSLVGFKLAQGSAKHIIPLFGHTFNQDTWSPHASNAYFPVGPNTQYIPSDEWLSSFIGHDDNFGSNFCIPRKFISSQQVKYVLSLLPYDIPGTPLVAEARAIDFLYKNLDQIATKNQWGQRWKTHIRKQDTVSRPLLISRQDYVEHIKTTEDWTGNKEDGGLANALGGILPQRLWMVELSIPDLYSANYSKIGEMLFTLDALNKQVDFGVLRIPGQYAFKLPGNDDLQSVPSKLTSHIPLYTREPGLLDFSRDHPLPPNLSGTIATPE